MSRRFQFSLKWLFVAMLVVAAFLGGVRFGRERQRLEDEAAARASQIAAQEAARERINRELFLQEQKVDRLLVRYNALVDEERRRESAREINVDIRAYLKEAAK